MTERLYRAQILLEKEQHQALAEIAENQERSISDLVREIVNGYLAEQQNEQQLQKELEALEKLRQIREKNKRLYGVYEGDLVAEVREERQRQINRVLGWDDGEEG